MTISRLTRSLTAATALVAAGTLAACGDVTSAPEMQPRLSVVAGDTTITTFTYDPASSLVQVFDGVHRLRLPAGAVCDPSSSGYGPSLWDTACAPLAAPLTFTARTWTDAAGHPRVSFSPDVRFVPGKLVTLELKDQKAAAAMSAEVLWCPTAATSCVDEALTDPTVATTRNATNGFLTRRVKHFSGYSVVVD